MRPLVGRLRRGDDGTLDQPHVGWLELYFDLVFIAAVIQLGNVLATDISWRGRRGSPLRSWF